MPREAFDRRRRRIYLEARLFGPLGDLAGVFLVDTGSEVTSVDPFFIDSLGYSARQARSFSRLFGPSESHTRGYVIAVDALEVLGTRHAPFEVHVHDMPREDGIDGLLGMDWLVEHTLTIDGPRGVIDLLG